MTREAIFWDYLKITRPDHWFKIVFILPGIFVGLTLTDSMTYFAYMLPFSLLSVCLTCSANYVLNEWVDREFDQHHPIKKGRSCVAKNLDFRWVVIEYLLCALGGLLLASNVSSLFLTSSALLLIMGVIYNVSPIRTKDRPYLDVLTESINNPIRFVFGWAIVVNYHIPPSSILLSYWMGGAFLMAIKRFAEYRSIGDHALAVKYRKSFAGYTEDTLLVSSFFYAICSSFFLAIFLIKYRIEYILLFPFLAGLFAWYVKIGMQPESPAQFPEKMHHQRLFWIYLCVLTLLAYVLSWVNLPFLKVFLNNSLISWLYTQ